MKIITKNLKQGIIKIKPENSEDLWTISTLLNKEDIVSGRTFRKIILGDSGSEKTKSIKKPVYLSIKVEKTELDDSSLKILGTVITETEDIPKGSHHTINLTENEEIEIKKEWPTYQIKKLDDATEKETANIIACLFNREEALFAKLEKNNFSIISKIAGDVEKKGPGVQKIGNFFKTIVQNITELNQRFSPKTIICASSHFWKSNLENELNENKELKPKVVFTVINEVGETGFSELLRRPELQNALKNQQAIKDAKLVDEIFNLIAKDAKVVYGIKDCTKAAENSAIDWLICSDNLIKKMRDNEKFGELENLFKLTETNGGEINIISGKGEHVKRLDGLGGISAKLRFNLE